MTMMKCFPACLLWRFLDAGTFAYVYLGGGARATFDAVGNVSDDGGGFPVAKLVLYGVGVASTLLATSRISKAATRALENPDRLK